MKGAWILGASFFFMAACASERAPRRLPAPVVSVVTSPLAELRASVATAPAGDVLVLDDRDGLAPDEAALMALDLNPRLVAVRAAYGLGEAELLRAGVLPNPRLAVALDAPTTGAEADVLGYGLGVSWNVTPLFARAARRAAAGERLHAIELDIAWQEWQVAGGARLAALRAIYLGRRLELALAIEQRWAADVEREREALSAGATTSLAVGERERLLAEAKLERLGLEAELVAERARLAGAIGLDARAEPNLDSGWVVQQTVPALDELLDELPVRRLDLAGLEAGMRSSNEAVRAATLARFPALEIGFGVSREVDRVGSAGLTVSVGLPFFDRNQAGIAHERAARVELAAEYAARLAEAESDVVRLVSELELMGAKKRAADEASAAAGKLAELAKVASARGALNPLLATELEQDADAARLRTLEIEAARAELRAALMLTAGRVD